MIYLLVLITVLCVVLIGLVIHQITGNVANQYLMLELKDLHELLNNYQPMTKESNIAKAQERLHKINDKVLKLIERNPPTLEMERENENE